MLNRREQCVFVGKAQNTQIVLLQRLVALRSSKHINLSMQSSYSNLSMVSDWTKADPDVFTTNTSKPGWCNVDPDEASASKRSAIVSMMDLGADSVSVRCLFRALVSINALGIAYAEVDFVRYLLVGLGLIAVLPLFCPPLETGESGFDQPNFLPLQYLKMTIQVDDAN
nr:probable glucuronoxylan glucuronosyltransferase F8H isoform X2 [Ipomoea batatas]